MQAKLKASWIIAAVLLGGFLLAFFLDLTGLQAAVRATDAPAHGP